LRRGSPFLFFLPFPPKLSSPGCHAAVDREGHAANRKLEIAADQLAGKLLVELDHAAVIVLLLAVDPQGLHDLH